jgi:Fe2+ or Zn2+ uptake regulation protein
MDDNQLRAICEPTRLKIFGMLAEKPQTNTEIYNRLRADGIAYRESVFKALKKLQDAGLIRREYHGKVGYKYSLRYRELKVNKNLVIQADGERKTR